MNNHSNESNKREPNTSENENNTDIAQSDLPLELLIEENNDKISDSQNENEVSKDKNQVQNIVMLNKYENINIKERKISFSIFIFGIIFLLFFSFYGISIADIVIQIINPNGLNSYLIDDILLCASPIIYGAFFIILGICIKNPDILIGIVASIFLILWIGGYIADNIIFFKYFFEKNQSPQYIKDFYLSYIIIKFGSLGLIIILGIMLIIYLNIIPKEKKKEEINSIELFMTDTY